MKPILTITSVVAIAVSSVAIRAAAATDQDWSKTQAVDIVMTNFDFAPKTLTLRQGQVYRLHFVNNGSGGHNFAAPEFFKASQINPDDKAAVAKGVVELRKGNATDVRLVPAAGTYKVKCTHFMHATFGMEGQIVVE